jgi:hypothetical protein
MNTKTLSNRALSIIDQYERFSIENAVCSIPYFNNKTTRARAQLKSLIGKGSPKDIYEEIMSIIIRSHIDPKVLSNESLKKLLVENNIGIDCSGFAYYILNAECENNNKGTLDKHIHFVNCHGIIGKMRCALRPIENCDVNTFAHEKNSTEVNLKDIKVGDIITLSDGPEGGERDHILVIYQIEYQNFVPTKIHYTHTIAYPTDGIYGTGIKKGTIQVLDSNKSILEQSWEENGLKNDSIALYARAKKSKTSLRRLKFYI